MLQQKLNKTKIKTLKISVKPLFIYHPRLRYEGGKFMLIKI